MRNPEWLLSWSGRWHLPHPGTTPTLVGDQFTYCKITAIDAEHTPAHLRAIRQGTEDAPLCKKCQRAAAKESA